MTALLCARQQGFLDFVSQYAPHRTQLRCNVRRRSWLVHREIVTGCGTPHWEPARLNCAPVRQPRLVLLKPETSGAPAVVEKVLRHKHNVWKFSLHARWWKIHTVPVERFASRLNARQKMSHISSLRLGGRLFLARRHAGLRDLLSRMPRRTQIASASLHPQLFADTGEAVVGMRRVNVEHRVPTGGCTTSSIMSQNTLVGVTR